MRITKHSVDKVALAIAWLLIGSGSVRADVPGYEFMMFPEGMAVVVDTNGKATKAKIKEDCADPEDADGVSLPSPVPCAS